MTGDGGITITWLGHATTRVQTPDGKSILIDPWVQGNPAVPEQDKSIDQLDLMLITHAHQDHMGDAIPIAKQTNPDVVSIFDFSQYLSKKGVEKVNGMNKGGTVEWNGIRITMVDAVHSAGFMENDTLMSGGSAAGYIIRFGDGFTVYHAGDTDIFESMRLIGRLYQPDLALLPIGDHFTMGPWQAAEAIRMLGVKNVIPIHYGTFPILTGTPDRLEQEADDVANLRVIALKPGESVEQSQIR